MNMHPQHSTNKRPAIPARPTQPTFPPAPEWLLIEAVDGLQQLAARAHGLHIAPRRTGTATMNSTEEAA